MRTSVPFLVLFLSLLVSGHDLAGQWLERNELARAEVASFEYSFSLPQLDPGFTEAPSWQSRILTGAGGALLGAFLGYFASQVAVGDWEVTEGAEEPSRPLWAAVGGSVGFAVGFKFPITGDASPPGVAGPFRSDRFTITGEEILEAGLTNAYDAVRLFRPQWLVQRGQDSFTESETDNIRVYLDSMEIGGVEALRQVNGPIIEAIRYFDSSRATARWGAGHAHGAIQIVTSG